LAVLTEPVFAVIRNFLTTTFVYEFERIWRFVADDNVYEAVGISSSDWRPTNFVFDLHCASFRSSNDGTPSPARQELLIVADDFFAILILYVYCAVCFGNVVSVEAPSEFSFSSGLIHMKWYPDC